MDEHPVCSAMHWYIWQSSAAEYSRHLANTAHQHHWLQCARSWDRIPLYGQLCLSCVELCAPFLHCLGQLSLRGTVNEYQLSRGVLSNNKLCERPPQYSPAPCKLTFDLLTLKVVSESRVTFATSMPILVFLRPLCSRLRPDVRDGQTSDVRRASSHNAPAKGAGRNNK